MNFTNFQGQSSAFGRVINVRDWAAEVKASEKVASLKVTNILQGKTDDAKYCIATLADGRSATMPVSKKATVGAPITDYMMAENTDGQWVVVTGTGADATEF